MHSKILLLAVFLLSSKIFWAQIPNGYYDSAEGLQGEQLRLALHNIIKNPSVESYNELWSAFELTDKKNNGKVWDMYSDVPGGTPSYEFTFGSDQCGNYNSEGDCYNREHSFPASWFNDASPMYSDLFHLYPTDGYVNNRRSNYPFGEVESATWTSTNGSKLGTSSYPGYSETVFEPIDEYKGDFARTYFYMLTCYMDKVNSWSSPILNGNNFADWAIEMLLQWNALDPVSEKEINRNNVVYSIQNNRNPFIDNPVWSVAIWDPNYDYLSMNISKLNYSIYPNPFCNYINISAFFTNSSNYKAEIINVSGEIVKSYSTDNENFQIETGDLNQGIYILRITNNNTSVVHKIIKSE